MSFQGTDFRRSIFVFLSNTGGKDITKKTYEMWQEGKKRSDFKYKDYEGTVSTERENLLCTQ